MSLIRAKFLGAGVIAQNRRCAIAILAAAPLFCLAKTQTTTPPKAPFSLALKPEQNIFSLDEPVKLSVTLTNTSDHAITVWVENPSAQAGGVISGQGGFVYKFHVLDEKGRVPGDTRFGKALRGLSDPAYLTDETPIKRSGGWTTLQPGKTLTNTLTVSTVFDFKEPGKYRIDVERFDDESKSFVRSNSTTVTIKN
jgi:hypothetical protein